MSGYRVQSKMGLTRWSFLEPRLYGNIEIGVFLLATLHRSVTPKKIKLMREGSHFTYSSTLPLTCSSRRASTWNKSWLQFILINHVCWDSNLRHLYLIPC
jgi:hypothetical protein